MFSKYSECLFKKVSVVLCYPELLATVSRKVVISAFSIAVCCCGFFALCAEVL